MSNLNERVCKEWMGLTEGTVEFVSELSKLEWADAMHEEEAVIYFTNGSSEFQETPDLIGEIYSDYSEAMEEFQAAISDENSPINVWADEFLEDMDFA